MQGHWESHIHNWSPCTNSLLWYLVTAALAFHNSNNDKTIRTDKPAEIPKQVSEFTGHRIWWPVMKQDVVPP